MFCFSFFLKRCLSELKDRVARGGDPTKLHEPPVEETVPENEPGIYLRIYYELVEKSTFEGEKHL